MPKDKKISYLLRFILILALFLILQLAIQTNVIPRYMQGVLMMICINIILATSLNITVGLLGQINLGHAGFMSIGAYTAGLFSQLQLFSGLPNFIISFLLGAALAFIVGLIVGTPGLRLKGDYLAIITLAFGEIIRAVIEFFKFTGGAQGLSGLPTYKNFAAYFWMMVISITLMYSLFTSRHGRAILAIREDEIAANSVGIHTTKAKILAFAISALFAGGAGAMYAQYMGLLTAKQFSFTYSIDILVMVVLGGMGSFTGAILSAIGLTILPELLRNFQSYRMIIYAIILIVVMIYHPSGLLGRKEFSLTKFIQRFKHKKERDHATFN